MELAFERRSKSIKFMTLMPLINVIFLLLTFFLITGKDGAPDALALTQPVASSGVVVENEPLVVLISTRGDVMVNNQPILAKDLMVNVARQLAVTPGASVLLKTDAALSAQQALDIMRQLQQAGATNVALAVQPGN